MHMTETCQVVGRLDDACQDSGILAGCERLKGNTHCLTTALRGHHARYAWRLGLLPHHVGVHALLTHHGVRGHSHTHAIHLQSTLL